MSGQADELLTERGEIANALQNGFSIETRCRFCDALTIDRDGRCNSCGEWQTSTGSDGDQSAELTCSG